MVKTVSRLSYSLLVAAILVALFAGLLQAQTLSVLHPFTGGEVGADPLVGVSIDKAGNLYGTTSGGGSSNDGTVFEFSPSGTHTILYTFTGGADGAEPGSDLILDKQGNLYGTTIGGGTLGLGVVYKVTP